MSSKTSVDAVNLTLLTSEEAAFLESCSGLRPGPERGHRTAGVRVRRALREDAADEAVQHRPRLQFWQIGQFGNYMQLLMFAKLGKFTNWQQRIFAAAKCVSGANKCILAAEGDLVLAQIWHKMLPPA